MNLKPTYFDLDAQLGLDDASDEPVNEPNALDENNSGAELETLVAFNPPNRGAPSTTAGAGSR